MSDTWGGSGWWLASDGRWYPPINDIDVRTAPVDEDLIPALATAEHTDETVAMQSEAAGATSPDPVGLSSHPPAVEQSTELVLVDDHSDSALSSDEGSDDGTPHRDSETAERPGRGRALLAVAVVLALATGVLATLWLRERATTTDLRNELAAEELDDTGLTDQIDDLSSQVSTLQASNDSLTRELSEASALVPPVPAGRLAEIDIPFEPHTLIEERGRFFAVDDVGNYAVWSDGVRSSITDSGALSGRPIDGFGARDEVWVATDAGTVEVISLVGADDGDPIATGAVDSMQRDGRAFWTFSSDSGELTRFRQSNGRATTSIVLPAPLIDLAVGAGAVWGLGNDGMIYRINTADFTVTPLDGGPDIISLAAGPDALWTLSAADGSLRRVDPVTSEVLVTVPVGRDPIDAEFSTNAVWVVLRSGATLIEVDTRTSAVVSRTALPEEPTRLHEGQNGVFVELAAGSVVRVGSADPEEAGG